MLKLSGKFLEDIDRKCTGHGTNVIKMHDLVNDIVMFSSNGTDINGKESQTLQDSIAELNKIRSVNWELEENQRPTYFDVPKLKTNAIKIVCPPDYPSLPTQQTNGGDQASPTKASEFEETNFTEDELQFMTDQMDARDLESMLNEESDDSSFDGRMPAEVEAAFEDFLNEQKDVFPLFQA